MPDLNSVPASPHALAHSRRQSSNQMPPPQNIMASGPENTLNILPSNQDVVNHPSSSTHDPSTQPGSTHPEQMQSPPDAAVGTGPGPLRHPRPMTASELHIELEKEQEAVVNRLTRELTLLRAAQNASVVSNASSASAGNSTHEPGNDSSLLSGSGFTIPTARRHGRTSSTTSNPALHLASSLEARPSAPRPINSISMSRQNSSTSRTSQTTSPGPQSSLDPSSYFHQQRNPAAAANQPLGATSGGTTSHDQLSPGLLPATTRYEETAFHRSELEAAKRENEILKRRIRELERRVRDRRSSDASRTRSDSASTTASVPAAQAPGLAAIAGPRETPARAERDRTLTMQSIASAAGSVGVGVPEDEVMVGESAASTNRAETS
ncbi:hypothetical protein CC79DRAFT_690777 [Sarocladium strictum]